MGGRARPRRTVAGPFAGVGVTLLWDSAERGDEWAQVYGGHRAHQGPLVTSPGHRVRLAPSRSLLTMTTFNSTSTAPVVPVMSAAAEGGVESMQAEAPPPYDELAADESLAAALQLLRPASAADGQAEQQGVSGERPSAVVPEDFVRNFLLRAGLESTLERFEAEWYELLAGGQLAVEGAAPVPDALARCEALEEVIRTQRAELASVRSAATSAAAGWERLRQERNEHRLLHTRAVQEKERLLLDAKRLRQHYAQFEPTIRELRSKFEISTREATRLRLERERLAAALQALQGAAAAAVEERAPVAEVSDEASAPKAGAPARSASRGASLLLPPFSLAPPADASAPEQQPGGSLSASDAAARLSSHRNLASDGASFSCLAAHPSKPLLASGSDAGGWRLCALPGGELLLAGEGHRSWVSACAFRPGASPHQLATGGGDGAVRLWDLDGRECVATMGEERGPAGAVWALHFRDDGGGGGGASLLAAASLDRCCRVWDATAARMLTTLRGHADSVNDCAWQGGGGGALATACGDRVVRAWDVRQGRPACMLQGHPAAVNALAWAPGGAPGCSAQLASADADGHVQLWDLRTGGVVHAVSLGSAVNRLAWDARSGLLAAGCDDGVVSILDAGSRLLAQLRGHSGAVQAVAFGGEGWLASAGADGAKLWGSELP